MGATSYCREIDCVPTRLCDSCVVYLVSTSRSTARAIGQLWARRVFRAPEHRNADWPAGTPLTLAIARRLVTEYARDPRLLAELARLCDEGAAEWWARRWKKGGR
jgi:hypothetical protein